ncbi:MAG: hypothetical protein DMF64_07070 [Acidobacteria bacterium]|nr:MAG: hypothetical protein DMF64_07070 [Acidobacteriota bacterium]
MSEDERKVKGWRQEYTEVNSYYRHYSALRFVMFSVYFAVTAGIASVAFGVVEIKSFGASLIIGMIKVSGLLITVAFLMYELRLEQVIDHYRIWAKKLEEELGYAQMTERPLSRLTFGTTKALYYLMIAFWSLAFILFLISVIWKA